MHLSYSVSRYKGRAYKSYAIAESYRDGDKVKKRILFKIGKLSDAQAEQIRMICKAAKGDEQVLTRLDDIVVKETGAYLDIAVVNELWNRLNMDAAFTRTVSESHLPTPLVAKILTINRCLDPCSHYSIPQWSRTHALQEVLGMDLSALNDDKLYYELDKIHFNQTAVEDHIFTLTYEQDPDSYRFIDYDLTTSYFVGHRCELSAFGKGKADSHGRKQVLIGVLINNQGYPFKWDVFTGNTAEVSTLKQNIDACKSRFHLNKQNVTLVFDRGIISEENADIIEEAELKYISALDKNQIPTCGISLAPFSKLKDIPTVDETSVIPVPKGFKRYDASLFFKDAEVVNQRRIIIGFNPQLFVDERNHRNFKLNQFETYLETENQNLKNAQKSRQEDATRARVINELKRLKIKKYYHDPVLTPFPITRRKKDGTTRLVNSFQVTIDRKTDIIESEKQIDGVCVFITNHTEKLSRGYKTSAASIIKAYRDKAKIEDVFKNVKSFLKIRPFYVNTDTHVRAVYTICIIAYFINRYLANQRKALGEKDFLNSKELYAPFRHIDIAVLEDKHNRCTTTKAAQLPDVTRKLIERLEMGHILWSEATK